MKTAKEKTQLVLWLAVVLVAVMLYNNYSLTTTLKPLISMAKAREPASLQFTEIVDSSCANCFNISLIANAIKSLNVESEQEILEYTSAKAQQLISKYSIKKIPTLIVSGEIDKLTIWSQLPGEIVDGVFVLNDSIPPYRNLETDNIEGLVTLITLTDSSCAGCYNTANHKIALSAYSVYLDKELTYDINSTDGKNYLKKYNITIVPTILISPEISAYTGLKTDWKKLNLGTIESDGWYVFRSTDVLGRWGNYTTLS